jgi:cytochrome b
LTKVWDLPLRLWHWAFALCVTFSLYSGLSGEISLLDWHQRSGMTILGLLLFRLAWGLWGGRYARFSYYWTTPGRVIEHFRGHVRSPHTAPGVALVVLLVIAVVVQATTGLMTTDDIFNEGPLVSYVDSETARAMSRVHHRVFWLIVALIATHLTAHIVYGLRRDPTPLSMFTGTKQASVAPTDERILRGSLTFVVAAALVWWAYSAL